MKPPPTDNRFLRLLQGASPVENGVESFSRRRLRRGVYLTTRDHAALERRIAEQQGPECLSSGAFLDHYLRMARLVVRRLMVYGAPSVGIEPGFILELPTEDWVAKVEDDLTRTALRLILESDSTSTWRARQDATWEKDPATQVKVAPPPGRRRPGDRKRRPGRIRRSREATLGDEPEAPDVPVLRKDEAAAILGHVFALATKSQKNQLRRVWAVLQRDPDKHADEAADHAGLTTDQWKKLKSRLRARGRPA